MLTSTLKNLAFFPATKNGYGTVQASISASLAITVGVTVLFFQVLRSGLNCTV